MSEGAVYIASGDAYVSDAVESARSLATHHPDLPCTLFTDDTRTPDVFDEVISLEDTLEEKGDSLLDPSHIRYDKTLYLDADTHVAGDITGVFDILDRFEIAAAHNEARAWYHSDIYEQNDIDIPETFPEYNTGVVGYRDTAAVRSLFSSWNRTYETIGYERNQPAFRVALYESDVNVGTLPPEYNFMTHTVGFASGEVKILHRGDSETDLAEWASLLNSTSGKKVTTWETAPCRVVPDSYKGWRYLLQKADREDVMTLYRRAKQARETDGTRGMLKIIWQQLSSVAKIR